MKQPDHYPGDLIQQVIEACDLNFARGNVIKYVCRAGRKGDIRADLLKALWYLQRELAEQTKDAVAGTEIAEESNKAAEAEALARRRLFGGGGVITW